MSTPSTPTPTTTQTDLPDSDSVTADSDELLAEAELCEPAEDDEIDALATPCFSACPSGGALRAEHQQCPDVADTSGTSLFLEQLTDEQRGLVIDKIT